jgi:hypothetical protein
MMSDSDLISIVNLEIDWKISNSTWLTKKIRKIKTKKKDRIQSNFHEVDEEDKDFIIDTIDDENVQDAMMKEDDFVDFKETKSDDDVQLHLKSERDLSEILNTEI